MNVLLLFFLSGLLLHGIKLLFNYLTELYENPEEALFSHSDDSMYANQLQAVSTSTINSVPQLTLIQETTTVLEKPAGKEIFMPATFHQSA